MNEDNSYTFRIEANCSDNKHIHINKVNDKMELEHQVGHTNDMLLDKQSLPLKNNVVSNKINYQEQKKLVSINVNDFFSNKKTNSQIINNKIEQISNNTNTSNAAYTENINNVNMNNKIETNVIKQPIQEKEIKDIENLMELQDIDLNIINDLFNDDNNQKPVHVIKSIDKQNQINEETSKMSQQTNKKSINKIIDKIDHNKDIKMNGDDIPNRVVKNVTINNTSNNINMKNDSILKNDSDKNMLWTSKYHPKNLNEIIGNQQTIKKLMDWLEHWGDVVLRGNKREIDQSSLSSNNFSTKGKNKIENINARCCIISGPPGIGKTSTVRLIAKLLNYQTFELNASDQRNKEVISYTVGFLMDNTTISKTLISDKNLIIMDEVDGMGGNEDKGGVSALIEAVKKTKVPIICICNDLQNQKLRSLVNHCYDLKFYKPDKRQIVKRLLEICKSEGLNMDAHALEYLCDSTGNDLRQCLNFLDMRSRQSKSLSSGQMKPNYNLYCKDGELMINIYDVCKKLLSKLEFNKMSHRERLDLFFIDFDLLPGLIYENYLTPFSNNRTLYDLRRIAKSAEFISFGDVIERKIKTNNEWNLLPNRGILSCIAPANFSCNTINFVKFPDYMGKFAKIRKVMRQLKELKTLFSNHSLRSIKEEIVPIIFSKITNTLISNGKEGIDSVIHILNVFKFSLILFKENLFDLQPNEQIIKKYTGLNSGIKSLLTKKLNEEFKTSITKKKKNGNCIIFIII